ncbi:GGDEF domain-containing protein [Vibrio sp. JC009]|uniref:GGDEF domain-containing protein n=1 Tax=Vibrio sp. JC009 TaxID=2912314 RepID=UPI0023B18BC4|nr:GGDEF domain-containing protein [Vibrio sp. JC009]WED23644.1 GGDEF domain-containing protein [Vibrio sp. JC009]
MNSTQDDSPAMAATSDTTFSLDENTGITVIQKDNWKHVAFPGGFKTSYAFIEDAILLVQGEGYSDLKDETYSVAFGDAILDAHLIPDKKYIMIQDWTRYKNSSAGARQYFIDSVVKNDQLKAIVFCNMTWKQAMTIKIAGKLKILDLDIHICNSVQDAVTTAIELNGSAQTNREEEPSSAVRKDPEISSKEAQPTSAHIQDLIDYLDAIDWQTGKLVKKYTVTPEHPMLPVFDAITFIKSQLDRTFEERNLIEQQLIHHRDNLEVLVQQRTQELELSKQKLAQLAIRDELTGLYNRRHFMQILTTEFERAKRYCSDMSIMIIDADHFKSINDTHGHMGGDAALIQLAQIIRKTFRELDTLFRIGGEEFAVILPQTRIEEALTVAERLRSNVWETEAVFEKRPISLSISIGVAMVTHGIYSKENLLKVTDDALYQAKRNGRNRIERHNI